MECSTNSILDNELCSGCGVCTAVCPKNCIEIKENGNGELRPQIDVFKCAYCGKCKTVCSFENKFKKEPDFQKCYIGVSPKFSDNASSGGMLTHFLEFLLSQKIVDGVITVSPQNNSDELFTYKVCRSIDELLACQGSAYYPVTLGGVLKEIKKQEGRFALVALPCFVNAVRNLQKTDGFWKEKIHCIVGITCGHLPSKFLVDTLAFSQNRKREDILKCRFRIKTDDRPAWDYGVKLEFKDKTDLTSFGSDDFGFLFWKRLFSQKCCNYCSDVFANNADVSFMDAWLDEYKEKTTGTSMVICRNSEYDKFFSELSEKGVLEETDIKNSVKAQEKLVDYKNNSGKHKTQEDLRIKVCEECKKYAGQPDIIYRIRRIVYKNELKSKNKVLWILTEVKDKVFNR